MPVLTSISCRALPAIAPPSRAAALLSSKPCGLTALEISVVEASASMFRTSSRFVILSRRFSFLRFLCRLYSETESQDQAFVISFVSMA